MVLVKLISANSWNILHSTTNQEVGKNSFSIFHGALNCSNVFMLHSNAGAGSEKLLKFKKWFWSILEKMPMAQRQDLVSSNKDLNFRLKTSDFWLCEHGFYLNLRFSLWLKKYC